MSTFARTRVSLVTLMTVFTIGLTLFCLVLLCASRSPISNPLSDLNLERELLAGSDALLERMVIPPNRPDWLLSQCADASSKGSASEQIRKVICEASRQAQN